MNKLKPSAASVNIKCDPPYCKDKKLVNEPNITLML